MAHLIGHHEAHAGLVDGVDDAVTILQRQRHGLLAENVLARSGRSQHHLGVAIGLAGDDDALDVRVVDHIVQVRRVGHAVVGRCLPAPFLVVIPAGDQLHVVVGEHTLAIRIGMAVGKADHADADFGCHLLSPRGFGFSFHRGLRG